MNSNQFRHLILCIEAALIILSLAVGGKAVIGMICYWTVAALFHLTDFLTGRIEDGKGK